MSALLLSMLCNFLAMALLALEQDRHWRRVMSDAPRQRRSNRRLAVVILLVGLAFCVTDESRGFAVLYFAMGTGFAALVVAMCLSFCPAALRSIAKWSGGCRAPATAGSALSASAQGDLTDSNPIGRPAAATIPRSCISPKSRESANGKL